MVSKTGPQQRRIPGEEGVWILILGDMLVFSLFFGTFLFYRAESPAVFSESQLHLNQTLGVINTFLMLSSSWFVAMAVQSARSRMGRVSPLLLLAAFGCGLGFAGIKVVEYSEKIRAGITLTTNDFYMYYFMFTGIHLLHVLIGMGVLAFLARHTWNGAAEGNRLRNLESGASFWHLVDLLWIVLFALLYLVR